MCKTKYNFTGDELYAKTERARERTHSHALSRRRMAEGKQRYWNMKWNHIRSQRQCQGYSTATTTISIS